ncbi:PP2C-domain-containing protein [Mytilinidion resinicola]|uniref:Adenylate cyclase n=1 Tax=Mytilinidion resinicola TaxID=574789 RepID=A0A6A6XZX1_9PEZI|nr:PP2C-domain-containing protein [Mytilinidion resinicola]KAF2801950.1 PP2C-domain-containing protein [Mytilinidion resinicola]
MTRKENVGRHGSTESSGADSWRSTDTVKALGGRTRGPPVKVQTTKNSKNHRGDREPEISPGTIDPKPSQNSKSKIAPWDNPKLAELSNYRKDLSVLETSGGRIPAISRNPPTATSPGNHWNLPVSNGSTVMPSSVFGSFYNDSSEDVGQLSPGFRPGSGKEDAMGFPQDDRRPSVASATTVSSSGSKSSLGRGFHKQLRGFFGEEFPGDSRQGSDTSLPTSNQVGNEAQSSRSRNRNNSVNNTIASSVNSRPTSPTSSRPRTPLPSSEVTPWEFQDFKVDSPSQGESDRYSSEQQSNKSGKTSHKLRLPGHRHNRSKDDSNPSEPRAEISQPYPLRPVTSREESSLSVRRAEHQAPFSLSAALTSRTNIAPRSSSPTPSSVSDMSRDTVTQRSPITTKGPRSILDKLRRKEKGDRLGPDSLRDLGSSQTSLQAPSTKPAKLPRPELPHVPSGGKKKGGIVELAQRDKGLGNGKEGTKKEHGRLPFKTKRTPTQPEVPRAKDLNEARADPDGNDALFKLDTDLDHMEGIINLQQPPMTPPTTEIFTGWPAEDTTAEEKKEPEGVNGVWDAPDSWAVRRVGDENIGRLRELDENGDLPKDEGAGPAYCVRIFRVDSTFAVLNLPLNTTVSEMIQTLGRRTFLQDDIDNYHIIMKKHDSARQLDPQERPLFIQKRLLEQAGYCETDRLEEVGREDNSYLCRFTFVPAKMSGYSSLEKDPGFGKLSKFSHIDLAGRNLVTIPITLYQKATEIISLNLSRNLSLDVPKDFIQACTNLREIKYTSNEAWRLPPSLSLASRLTMLDISNNRIEQLEHADLHKLAGLQGLRLSNNKLTRLPSYFGQYRSLRSLNLSSNSLTEFPDFLCEVRTIVDLDISFNSISTLPKIGQLTSLERLWATNNKLSGSFPASLSNLASLREIDVRFNALDSIDVMSTLPRLEYLMVGHNSISAFEGSFPKIRVLHINHNPVTRFGMNAPVPTLSILNLASAKLSHLPEDLFQKISGLTKLILDKNHFTSLSTQIGRLYRLEHLSIARNSLDEIPAEVGRLAELRYLDVRENNLAKLPQELWHARRLETLNVSSNVLEAFPKPGAPLPFTPGDVPGHLDGTTPASTPGLTTSPSYEELGKLEAFAARRPSQASAGYLGTSPSSTRKGSMASASSFGTVGTRKASVASRATEGTITPVSTGMSRKDSSLSNRMITTFAGSLRHVFLADNRLTDDVFDELALLPELRIVNLSYNAIYDIPPRTIRRWQHLAELYLSGNDLSSLPAEDLEEVSSLKVLHINGNKFQVLPAELGKVAKLTILDLGSNLLKYNVSNWPYDWNWNWNHNLKYLNMSGNKRLEIKPSGNFHGGSQSLREGKDLTDFTSLLNLRVLGLMDVTMMVPSVPEQTDDRRVRTSGSTVGTMAYGMADSLGRNEHISTMDMVIPRFRSHDDETIVGLFDGQPLSNGGSKIAKYLYDNFKHRFAEELDRLRPQEDAVDALRRTYLGLNKELATAASASLEARSQTISPIAHRGSISMPELGDDDLNSGSVATVLYIKEMELFVSNIGDAQALLIRSEGGHRILTRKHDPAETSERNRIREAGGFVSRQGKLNDFLEVSRAFGYVQMSPSVIAAPHITRITISENDEMVLLASRELWDYLTPGFAVDVARSERDDLMRAAQKLRDLAIAFGATNKIMVMILGVRDLQRSRQRARFRTHSMSMGPSGTPDDTYGLTRKTAKNKKDKVGDSGLARLDQEVDAPTNEVSLVFTDIKNSTILWETYPSSMRSAIKMHNEVMRRQLRIIGGYEVKTEGDAFMVAFPTVTSALLWCFTVQSQLLDVQWPQEILTSVNGQEVVDPDGNIIFRGLSVRMGIHWGQPVCEIDPVTKRMDYFGPMVNRTSRISSVADGGQITVSSDFIAEIQRLLETHIETDRTGSTGSEDTINEDLMTLAVRRELRSLSSQGFEVKDLGERRLKGLENPEYIYLMYPHALSSRLLVQQQRAEAAENASEGGAAGTKMRDSQLTIDTEHVWDLWNVSLRLEMLCSALENPGSTQLKPPETQLLERMKNRGGEITDRFLINFVEHQISRIETCTTTLAIRHLVRPFGSSPLLQQACPMQDIFVELQNSMKELAAFKAEAEFPMAPS